MRECSRVNELKTGTHSGRPLPVEQGAIMSYRETEFCRRQAERLQRLAEVCRPWNPETDHRSRSGMGWDG